MDIHVAKRKRYVSHDQKDSMLYSSTFTELPLSSVSKYLFISNVHN